MGIVRSHMTMSLDGFIADADDGIGELFGWYDAGPVAVQSADNRWTFHVDEASASLLGDLLNSTGALVCGRRLFDLTSGWGDSHPMGVPVVVVTHLAPVTAWRTITFAGDVPTAIEQARVIAGEKDVTISSADIARQALVLGLLDEVAVSIVPVLLGAGIPYFAELSGAPYRLDDPVVVPGTRATHLRYAVRRDT